MAPPGDLPHPRIEPAPFTSAASAGGSQRLLRDAVLLLAQRRPDRVIGTMREGSNLLSPRKGFPAKGGAE